MGFLLRKAQHTRQRVCMHMSTYVHLLMGSVSQCNAYAAFPCSLTVRLKVSKAGLWGLWSVDMQAQVHAC